MVDKDLQYFINFDFDTDDRDQVIIHDFGVNNRFSDPLDVYVGKAFVPGSRDWLNGSTTTRFSDRTLACTFFRPDRTVGVWAEGEYLEDRFYRIMVGDGFNTNGLQPVPGQIGTNFVYSGTTWWDIGGEYGRGYSDLENHQVLATEIGTSFTYARQDGPGPIEQPRIEQNFIRLADGTRLELRHGVLLPPDRSYSGGRFFRSEEPEAGLAGERGDLQSWVRDGGRLVSDSRAIRGQLPHLADLWRLRPEPRVCRWRELVSQRHAQLRMDV